MKGCKHLQYQMDGEVLRQSSVARKGERMLRPAGPARELLFKEHLSVEFGQACLHNG
jgi:hypothetical protein